MMMCCTACGVAENGNRLKTCSAALANSFDTAAINASRNNGRNTNERVRKGPLNCAIDFIQAT
jgi:hypothetical protein